MPGWKFWEKPEQEAVTPPVEPEAVGRFGIRPRTDLVGGELPADHAAAARVSALRKRRDEVLFDVEQATLAGEADNPWLVRIATIDEATRAVEAEVAALAKDPGGVAGAALPPVEVSVVAVSTEPPPRVTIQVGEARLVYAEDLDWAERGTQIARSDLHLEEGDVASLAPADVTAEERDELAAVLGDSLFWLATDGRDRAIAGREPPGPSTLGDLARPDAAFGGWMDATGASPRRRARDVRRGELAAELERLRTERDRELEERARWRERLPVAIRRLKDVDAQIAAALGREAQGGR